MYLYLLNADGSEQSLPNSDDVGDWATYNILYICVAHANQNHVSLAFDIGNFYKIIS